MNKNEKNNALAATAAQNNDSDYNIDALKDNKVQIALKDTIPKDTTETATIRATQPPTSGITQPVISEQTTIPAGSSAQPSPPIDLAIVLLGLFRKQKDANTFVVERANIVHACRALRVAGFEHLSLITAIDWKKEWELVYHIAKYGRKELVVLRVIVPYQDPVIPSITSVWEGAGWHERETYDLMGIKFGGNHDLRRILLPENFEGHPLRKEVKYGNTS